MRIKFIPAVICLALALLGVALGMWQLSRAAGKQALLDARQARQGLPVLSALPDAPAITELVWRRVALRGQFVADWPVYLDNRQQQGQPGVWVMMPFRLQGSGKVVLVARGWVARDVHDRTRIAPYATPSGEVVLNGEIHAQVARLMQLGHDAALKPGVLRQNLDPAELAAVSGLPLLPLVIEQSAPVSPQDVMGRDWPQASMGIERHQGYAFQWFALAAVALVFLVMTGIRRGTA